jgi:dolichol-phosphate mannosyltransferase
MDIVIIPTYNEINNIKKLIEKIFALNLDLDILIVDDNSSDGTGELIDKMRTENSRLNIIHRGKKLGYGSACVQGFKWCFERNYGCIFKMDADFSHNPEYLCIFKEELKTVDFVIGSRYIKGGCIKGWPWYRLFLSRFGNLYARLILNIPVYDCTTGFNGFNTYVLKNIEIDKIKANGYGFQIELVYRALKKGYKFKEVPIAFVDRICGVSKISKRIIFEAMVLVWKLKLSEIFKYKK